MAGAIGIAEHGETVDRSVCKARMCAISQKARAARERPRVALIEWIEPLMVCGNWTPELIGMAGGVNLFGEPESTPDTSHGMRS